MFKGWIYVWVSFWLLALAGCASSGTVKEAGPISTNTPVSLEFVLVKTMSSLNDAQADAQLLNEKIITGLRETQIFGTISGNQTDVDSSNGIKVEADIKEIKSVSPDARTWFGGFAGHARILIHVTVSDLNSGKQIQAFETAGESGASARSGTTDEAIQRAAQMVVMQIVKISRLTSQ